MTILKQVLSKTPFGRSATVDHLCSRKRYMSAFQKALHGSVPPATKPISRMSYLDVAPDPGVAKMNSACLETVDTTIIGSTQPPTTSRPWSVTWERSVGAFGRPGRAGHLFHGSHSNGQPKVAINFLPPSFAPVRLNPRVSPAC